MVCHRAFTDYPRTLEAGRALREYGAVALSLSFEGDYPAALRLLEQGGVPVRAADRRAGDPIVIAGGMAPSLNPEPLAPFVDVVFIGECEVGLARLHAFLFENRRLARAELLQSLAETALPGVYVPSAYQVEEEEGRVLSRRAVGSAPPSIERVWASPNWESARTNVWAPGGPFRGAYLLEVSRGCPHGCRFCAAGYAIRPARYLATEVLEPWLRFGVREFGRVGLVGAAVSDHPEFEDMARTILADGGEFSVSSFRVENLDRTKLELLARGGMKTLTMALEAGTDRLRRALGKDLREDQLHAAAKIAGDVGIRALRIYAMVGLPGETEEDVRALADLAIATRKALGKGTVTLSVAPFVPKPHTPFQWESMAPETLLRGRIRALGRQCGREPGVRVVAEAPKWSRVQGLFSRGGRSASDLLEIGSRAGEWREVLRSPLAAHILDRPRDTDEALPWDFVAGVPDRALLRQELQAASRGVAPMPCHPGVCRVCGVC